MRLRSLVVALLVVSAGCLAGAPTPDDGGAEESAADATTAATSSDRPVDGPRVTVTEVVDGDTMHVAYANGSRDTVRLLGVDTPEIFSENDPADFEGVPETDAAARCLDRAGEAASAYAVDRLEGKTVTLVFDEESDRRGYYGRLLAYIYVDGESFNHDLLREGHARVYPSTFTERERYERTAAEAREARRGLWSCIDDPGAVTTADSSATGTAVADGGGPLVVEEIHEDAAGNDNENLNDEYVVFRNVADRELDLSGWTVADEVGHEYTFAEGTTLAPDAELTLRTGSGSDTDSTVYWGADGAIWNNDGDVVVVRDASGSTVLRRSY
ncbi:lamin tail domain-containing protein [Halobellus rufus]|uniref:lamin tail domain-containing protein n=1 Tax=Halobellus rufus TaxID=1448860 RepID=UPI0006788E84|nr:lamin tail domain-containing protein [Halobellus rufus]